MLKYTTKKHINHKNTEITSQNYMGRHFEALKRLKFDKL